MKYKDYDTYELNNKIFEEMKKSGVDGCDVIIDRGSGFSLRETIEEIESNPDIDKKSIAIVGTVVDEVPSKVGFQNTEIRILYCITWKNKKE